MSIRRALAVACLAVLSACSSQTVILTHPRVQGAEAVVWLGLDYSGVQMIGLDAFNEPDRIFPGFLEDWNRLFLREKLETLSRKLQKPVTIDTGAVEARNRTAGKGQILLEDGNLQRHVEAPRWSEAQVAGMVKGYDVATKRGVGLVFIVERMVKVRGARSDRSVGCVWRVFFDLESREILMCHRGCHDAAGFGFRNYWFNVVKEALQAM